MHRQKRHMHCCICGRCYSCNARCLCGRCSSRWKHWVCPLNQCRVSAEQKYVCPELRSNTKSPDTWPTRAALFGVFGRNFETVIVCSTYGVQSVRVVEDCIDTTCEECRQELRPFLTHGEQARICWPCYAVILHHLGNMLESVVADAVWNIMQYLDTTAETDLSVLRYTEIVPQASGRPSVPVKKSKSAAATPVQLPGPVQRSRPPSHTMSSRQLMYWLQGMKRQELVSRIQTLDPGFSPEGMTRMMPQATLKHLYACAYLGLAKIRQQSRYGT